jgi:hypothetical protein
VSAELEVRTNRQIKAALRQLAKLSQSAVAVVSRGEHRGRSGELSRLASSGGKGSVGAGKRLARLRKRRRAARVKNADLIRWHAAGAGNLPVRDWPGAAIGAPLIRQSVEDAVKLVASGAKTAMQAHDRVGKRARETFARVLRARIPPPLSESTRKDPDRDRKYIPLLDTGALLRSIDTASEWT